MYHVSTAISNETLSQFIDQVLKPQLPYSLPLFRRCQYHATQTNRVTTPEIWFVNVTDKAAFDAHPPNDAQAISWTLDKPWLAAYIDLSNAGQTQVWTFTSWEPSLSESANPVSDMQKSGNLPIYQHLFFTLFRHLRRDHIPKLSPEPTEQWQRLRDAGKLISLPFSRSKVLFGTLAECHWSFLDEYSSESERAVSREDKGYLKYIVTSMAASLATKDPPHTLHFAPMKDAHLQTILDRTIIPRTIETLRQLHVIGLFNEDEECVAWGMLGKDASISSLHTEPDHRRKGLAEAVSKQLLADQIKIFVDHADEAASNTIVYSHADVSKDNLASRKVMEKLGGKVMWKTAWIEVELGE